MCIDLSTYRLRLSQLLRVEGASVAMGDLGAADFV